jgi:hypothetical protein
MKKLFGALMMEMKESWATGGKLYKFSRPLALFWDICSSQVFVTESKLP